MAKYKTVKFDKFGKVKTKNTPHKLVEQLEKSPDPKEAKPKKTPKKKSKNKKANGKNKANLANYNNNMKNGYKAPFIVLIGEVCFGAICDFLWYIVFLFTFTAHYLYSRVTDSKQKKRSDGKNYHFFLVKRRLERQLKM